MVAVYVLLGAVSFLAIIWVMRWRDQELRLARLARNGLTIPVSEVDRNDRVVYTQVGHGWEYWLVEPGQLRRNRERGIIEGGRMIVSDEGSRITDSEIMRHGINFERIPVRW